MSYFLFFKKNITVVTLDFPTLVDLTTNKFMATTLSAMAEFENKRRKDRQKWGIRAVRKKEKYQGWRTFTNNALIQKVEHLKETKNLSITVLLVSAS